MRNFGPVYGTGTVVGLGIRSPSGELFYTHQGKYLGSTNKLEDGEYIPAIGANASCKVKANFAGPFLFNLELLNNPVQSLILSEVAENPSVVLFIDGVEEAHAAELKKEFNKAGETYTEKDLKFFLAESGESTSRLRDFAGIPKPPLLAILDFNGTIQSGKYAIPSSTKIDHSSILKFIADWKTGGITQLLKSGPRPEGDKHPTHKAITMVVANSFNEIIVQSSHDVLLDVYADWCGPCNQLAPTYAFLADTLQGLSDIVIAKLDRDQNDVDPKYLPERGIPNIKLFAHPNKEKPIKYGGDRSLDDFLQFLHDNTTKKFDLEAAKNKGKALLKEAEKLELKKVIKIHSEKEYHEIFDKARDKLIVVDFFAVWCGPCKAIAPVFAEHSITYPDAIFLKVDVDDFQPIASAAEIKAMPTFQFYKHGNRLDVLEGADRKALEEKIKQYI